MSLKLHFHPLSSFCWKALIALYENDTPFTPHLVDLGNPEAAGRCAERNRSGFQHHRVSRQALCRPHPVHP